MSTECTGSYDTIHSIESIRDRELCHAKIFLSLRETQRNHPLRNYQGSTLIEPLTSVIYFRE